MKQDLIVKDIHVNFFVKNEHDFISLTDIARFKDAKRMDDVIKNWLRNKNTLQFLGLWEQINNPGFRMEAGLNHFVMTSKRWIEGVNAIGIVSKAGRYGGTFAHKDIAFEFDPFFLPRHCEEWSEAE
ncbi:KilA-N domain-containing protein [Patescibacteria group bacterium]|nr:KilA-N domain-containing protein [Patescibacteria group bacterium]MBU1721861.1 KilA-N domain-containing protein [Patescibacteria group bacterium]MBU1901319.1 KilA-N domain-containing protein [Patescibacteria group bacterium]